MSHKLSRGLDLKGGCGNSRMIVTVFGFTRVGRLFFRGFQTRSIRVRSWVERKFKGGRRFVLARLCRRAMNLDLKRSWVEAGGGPTVFLGILFTGTLFISRCET